MKRLPKRRPNSAKTTKSSPVRVTYIGATGSLEAVCKQVFRWNHDEGKGSSDPVLVIVWHEGWTMPGCEHWRELYEELGRATSPIRILVALFDGTPECLKQRSDGSRLSLLFRIIGVNPAHPVGWASITDVARFQSAAIRWEKSDAGLALRLNANKVCGPLGFSERAMAQWDYFAGHQGEARRNLALGDAFCALEGIIELQGQPDVLVFDDLAGFSGATANAPHEKWNRLLAALGRFFRISRPVFPVQQRHAQLPDELLPIVRAEIERLPRPLAAIVDMNWVYADSETEEADPEFGLKLIRLIREAKPTLPIIVWSTVKDKRILQRSLQYGAMFYFDKHKKIAYGQHHEDATDDEHGNFLNRGKLWFHILEWEFNRYQMPPVGKCGDSFLLADTSESKEARRKFLKTFDLTESDLLAEHEPEIERLLRALVPDAEQIEILRFFGEGLSGAERPFVVRGRTASGRWLRPVQIKIGRDWRALAREGKGYRDVFARSLGPSVAHVESGPYRIGGWCGMAQSFAAPEEAIREIATKSTRSLEDWLRKNLWRPDVCKAIVNELFEGLLDPFYKGNIAKSRESVVRAFERVTPAHLEAVFSPAPEKHTPADIDLTPQELSFQNEKARREMACRRWRVAEQWFARKPKEAAQSLVIRGMVIDTLEINRAIPCDSRMRLLDRTLGVKVDLTAGNLDVARRWESLAESPIKLRGLPVSFSLKHENVTPSPGDSAKGASRQLLFGWERSVAKRLHEAGLDASAQPLKSKWKPGSKGPDNLQERLVSGAYFGPCHPLDWTEEFHIGPTHGDLNLGNILLHKKEESYFPWLIDFDKAEDNRPVVFDLAKLEIEAYHKIGQELYWELQQLGCAKEPADIADLFRDFERCLESDGIENIDHLWERFEEERSMPESLKLRFTGFYSYLKQVHKRVGLLGIERREFLIGRALYSFCCLKFKNLYEAKSHSNAPFPAQVLVWKLRCLLQALDAENGIVWKSDGEERRVPQEKAILDLIESVRSARVNGDDKSLHEVVSDCFTKDALKEVRSLPNYGGTDNPNVVADWETVFRLLRDRQIPGKGRWFREMLWYARDHGVAKEPKDLAAFTLAMVRASLGTGAEAKINLKAQLKDFASTGRPGNAYPALKMFEQIANGPLPFVKISSRGESGGTIDILEKAGVPLCKSAEMVKMELQARHWALATTSADLCEVDRLLMRLRRETNCMKVSDLVVASISAKKLAVGVGEFDVQVVIGYDSKTPEYPRVSGTIKGFDSIEKRWKAIWKEIQEELGVPAKNRKEVRLAEPASGFDSDDLLQWFNQDSGPQLVVFGTALLAAQIWRGIPNQQPRLRTRMPTDFCKKMDDLGKVLLKLEALAIRPPCAKETLISLTRVNSLSHLSGVQCWRINDLGSQFEELCDIAVMMFRFRRDIRKLVRVPFFDQIYSDVAKSGNPVASVVFAPRWIAVLRRKSDISSDLHAWCWNVLREGFDEEIQKGNDEPPRQRETEVKFEGGHETYERIVRHLRVSLGFATENQGSNQRLHFYFDGTEATRKSDERVRLVVAPGEWVRYDFKAPLKNGQPGSKEVERRYPKPIPVAEAIANLIAVADERKDRETLRLFKNSPGIEFALLGNHHKTEAFIDGLKLEVSWDDLILLDSGTPLSEVEIELKRGPIPLFRKLVESLERKLLLKRTQASKYQQALALKAQK